MGDRGNIAVKLNKQNDQVWLYSHWGGSELPGRLQEGLKAGRPRWTDPEYLTRIIISNAIPLNVHKEETGYGISCRIGDNEHPINVVDIPNQIVFTMPEEKLVKGQVPKKYVPEAGECWAFEEYCNREISDRVNK